MNGLNKEQHQRFTYILQELHEVDRAKLLNAIETTYDHAKLSETERARLKWDLWTSERVKKLPQWQKLQYLTKRDAAAYLDYLLFNATGNKGSMANVNLLYKIDHPKCTPIMPSKLIV